MNQRLIDRPSRRQFLKATATGSLAPLFLPSATLGRAGTTGPNSRIVMASIGTGGRGTSNTRHFARFQQVQLVATCDPVPAHRQRARDLVNRHYGNNDCETTADFREVLARKDIDAIMIGTPDHWHAYITVAACKAKKDVFCEKPETLTVREGRVMANAIEASGIVFSGGSQRVLGDYGSWPRLVRGGGIGEVKEVFVGLPWGSSVPCDLPAEETPEGVAWDMWLGQAPVRPFHHSLIRGQFRKYREYSGGGMTDWGAHRFGAAMFAVGRHQTGPTKVEPPRGSELPYLTYTFADGLKMYQGGTDNLIYVGSEGVLTKGKDAQTRPASFTPVEGDVDMKGYKGSGGLFGDFLHCVQTRETPFRDIESAHRACTMCHIGNIALWLDRPLKWDPNREQFLGDEEANSWVRREKRAPWTV